MSVPIQVVLPAVLTVALGIEVIHVEGLTLAAALQAAFVQCPAFEAALCDEAGAFREHVLCLLETGGETLNTRWLPNLDRALVPGDRIVIMQAVSGG